MSSRLGNIVKRLSTNTTADLYLASDADNRDVLILGGQIRAFFPKTTPWRDIIYNPIGFGSL